MNPATRHESLLIEIGTEELPPKALDTLASAFARGVTEGLARNGVAIDADSAPLAIRPAP
jgi:glycyl-tRNA synthetase beta chain